MKTLNLLLVGKTGVGKSTLINALAGSNIAPVGDSGSTTMETKSYDLSEYGKPLIVYDTRGFELSEVSQSSTSQEIEDFIKNHSTGDNEEDIHGVWYCVKSGSSRVELAELNFLKSLKERFQIPFFIIITHTLSKNKSKALSEYIKESIPDAIIHIMLAQSDRDLKIRKFGLEELLNTTKDNVIPFLKAQHKRTLEKRIKEARNYVHVFSGGAFLEGAIPVPFADAAMLIPTQIGMIATVSGIFKLPLNKTLLAPIVTSLAGTVGATFAGRTIVSNIFKFIPGIGSIAGGAISGATAVALTETIGNAYIAILKTILKDAVIDMDAENIVEKIKNEIMKGK